ncbi:MAG: hypothetical protein K6A65_01870 [Succinivibrionaceae bacterium]|nr:hypothetical protein [Succinivibrionaceae bacterium]
MDPIYNHETGTREQEGEAGGRPGSTPHTIIEGTGSLIPPRTREVGIDRTPAAAAQEPLEPQQARPAPAPETPWEERLEPERERDLLDPSPAVRHPRISQAKVLARQLAASGFAFTSLSGAMPATAMRLGPSSPALMPLPIALCSLIAAGLAATCLLISPGISAIMATLCFMALTGTLPARGIGRLMSVLGQRRQDGYSATAAVICPTLLLMAELDSLLSLQGALACALAFAAAAAMGSCAALSLCLEAESDPMDSFGMVSRRGLTIAAAICLVASLATLNPAAVASALGCALLMRVGVGACMRRFRLTASREIVHGMACLIMLATLLDLVAVSARLPLVAPWL